MINKAILIFGIIPVILLLPVLNAGESPGHPFPLIPGFRVEIPVRGSMKYRGMEGNILGRGEEFIFTGYSLEKGLFFLKPGAKVIQRVFPTAGYVDMGGAFHGGRFYFGDSEGYLYSIDEDGEIFFRFNAGLPVKGRPCIQGDLVFFPLFPDGIIALNRGTGKKVWTRRWREEKEGIGIQVSPELLVHEGLLIFGTSEGVVIALNPSNGEEVWKWSGEGEETKRDPVPESGITIKSGVTSLGSFKMGVLACLYNRGIFLLSKGGGEMIRRFEVPVKGEAGQIEEDLFFATTDGRMISFSLKDWDTGWEFERRGDTFTDPFIFGDMVVAGTRKGRVYFLDREKGYPLWSWRPELEEVQITARPLFFKGYFLVLSNSGVLYGLKIPDFSLRTEVKGVEEFHPPELPDLIP